MTKKYEVQEFNLCGGWANNWCNSQDGGLTYFYSKKDAELALDWFLKDCLEEVEAGNMEDCPDREDFRIVKVYDDEEELAWIEKTSRLASAKTEEEVEAIIAQHKGESNEN